MAAKKKHGMKGKRNAAKDTVTRSKFISIRVTPERHADYMKRAALQDMSVADYITKQLG